MKKVVLFITWLLITLNFVSLAEAAQKREVYIILNVDKTILDRVLPCEEQSITALSRQGFYAQQLEFIADKESSPKFLGIYEIISKGGKPANESEFMSKIIAHKISPDKFEIKECVVRPTIKYLLEQIKNMDIPVSILLTSRNDDARTKNLHDKLNLIVSNRNFSEITTFIPRSWFRIKIKKENGEEISVKSAQKLREEYKRIKPQDVVILLDHLENSRFIKGRDSKDFNIVISKFELDKNYNKQRDGQEMKNIVAEIRKRLNISEVNK